MFSIEVVDVSPKMGKFGICKDELCEILKEMVLYLNEKYYQVELIKDPRTRLKVSREISNKLTLLNPFNIRDWADRHDILKLVYLANGNVKKVAGVLSGWVQGGMAFIDSLYVSEDYRHLSLATTMLRLLYNEMRGRRVTVILIAEPRFWLMESLPPDMLAFLKSAKFEPLPEDMATDKFKWGLCL